MGDGHFRDFWWFQAPPKVRVVPEILGSCPSKSTRGVHPCTGNRNGDGDLKSGHLSGDIQDLDRVDRVTGDVETLGSPSTSSTPQNLTRFVGQLWRVSTARTFAMVVWAEPAPIIKVKMQPRGGGNRG